MLNGIFYTVKDLAEKWGCAVVTIKYHIAKGHLEAVKLGQTFLVEENVVKAFESENNKYRIFSKEKENG